MRNSLSGAAKWAIGVAAAAAASGVCAPLSAAALSDEDARAVAASVVEGQFKKTWGERAVQYAPIEASVPLGEARRVIVRNLSYSHNDIRVTIGQLSLLVEPALPQPTAEPGAQAAGVGPIYPVSFHLPDSLNVLNKGKPSGTVQIGFSSIRVQWAPKVRSILASTSRLDALAFSGPQGVTGSISEAVFDQDLQRTSGNWSSKGLARMQGLAVEGPGVKVRLDQAQETVAVDGFPLEAWTAEMTPLPEILAKLARSSGNDEETQTAFAAILGLFSRGPALADHIAVEMKTSGLSVDGGDIKVGIGQFGVTMGYDGLPAVAAAEGGDPTTLGRYRFDFTMDGLSVPQQPLRKALGPESAAFVSHTIPTGMGFRLDVSNVPTRALLELANRANVGKIQREHKDSIADTADETSAKLAGDGWELLKRVRTQLETGFDVATDMVKLTSASHYVADAGLPAGGANTTKMTVSGLDDLLASYKAPDHVAAVKPPPVKPVPGKPSASKPPVVDDASEQATVLNYALLGIRFVKGIGNPRVSDGAIVYDYLIETDQNGTTRINGQDFAAMADSFTKNQPSKM